MTSDLMGLFLRGSKTTPFEPALAFLTTAVDAKEIKVSFCGSRYIVFSQISGCASLDLVTSKTNEVFNEIRKSWSVLNRFRPGLKYIEAKIDHLYSESDKMVKRKNWLTQFFVWIREFSFSRYTNRFCWENNTRLSNHYTQEQWREAFPGEVIPSESSLSCSSHPNVYYHA